MARFTKKVEFVAYQFDPAAVKGLDDYDLEDVIIKELGINEDIKHAFVTDKGTLYVVFYAYAVPDDNACFELNPTDWLTVNDFGGFTVVTDEKFKEFATAA